MEKTSATVPGSESGNNEEILGAACLQDLNINDVQNRDLQTVLECVT